MDSRLPPDENMDLSDPDFELYRVCSVLESIAQAYTEDSSERQAIDMAANAYILVYKRRQLLASFAKFLHAYGGKVSESMKANLQRQGLDADVLAAELEEELKNLPPDVEAM